jgi:hypothetical protein
MKEVPAPETVFTFKICIYFNIIDKGKCPRICKYMTTRAYNWIPHSQFSPIHTSPTIHNMNIVTADFWVGSNINTTYR